MGTYADRDRTLKAMGFADYAAYLGSLLWRRIREEVLRRDGKKCRICGVATRVVHHDDYNEATLRGHNLDGLFSLCDEHHEAIEFRENRSKRSMLEVQVELRKLLTGSRQPAPPKPKTKKGPRGPKGGKKQWKAREEREYVPRTPLGAALVAKRLAFIAANPKRKIPARLRWGRIRRMDERAKKAASGPVAHAGPFVPREPRPYVERPEPVKPKNQCPFVVSTRTRATPSQVEAFTAEKVAFMRRSPYGRMPAELQDIRVWLGAKKRESAPLVL